MKLLVPMPIRPNLSPVLRDKCEDNLHKLLEALPDEVDATVVFDHAEYPKQYDHENFFARLARMRQSIIDDFLAEDIDDVLWIDADIVEYPANLYQRLRDVSETGIVSPVVLIEGTEFNYDTASFREDLNERSTAMPPWFKQLGPIVELLSVGGCVLVPADVHRKQKFYAQDDEDTSWNTEWLSICSYATQNSLPVLCDTRIRVYHAHLPNYGESYH